LGCLTVSTKEKKKVQWEAEVIDYRLLIWQNLRRG